MRELTKDENELIEVIQSGYGGISKRGHIVDRRNDPDATPIPANDLLRVPEPKEVKRMRPVNRGDRFACERYGRLWWEVDNIRVEIRDDESWVAAHCHSVGRDKTLYKVFPYPEVQEIIHQQEQEDADHGE